MEVLKLLLENGTTCGLQMHVKEENFNTRIKMDSQKMSYNAGQAKGETQEKASSMMDKANNAAQSAQESLHEAGQQMKAKAQGAADAVKNATGMNN
ncbi:hypothetical protein CR513_29583, partial [Mucuna pruriens]